MSLYSSSRFLLSMVSHSLRLLPWVVGDMQCDLTKLRQCKTPSTLAKMSKQHCRMLQSRMFLGQSRTFLRHCCGFWQQCWTSFALKCHPFNKVECCFIKAELFVLNIVARNGNNVKKVVICFDNVASTSLLVWTGLYRRQTVTLQAKTSEQTNCVMRHKWHYFCLIYFQSCTYFAYGIACMC